jgi:glycerol-3-phosphate acyltransferase PlsY
MCGFAAIIGHIYPIFYNFKGGKGAGTAVGMLFAIYPSSVLVAVISWLIILISTGYVGLSTIIGSITIPIQLQYSNHYFEYYHFFSIILSFLIIFTHHSNIKRMIQGNENQFKKVMVFKKLYNSS